MYQKNSVIFNDIQWPECQFQGHGIFRGEYLKNGLF